MMGFKKLIIIFMVLCGFGCATTGSDQRHQQFSNMYSEKLTDKELADVTGLLSNEAYLLKQNLSKRYAKYNLDFQVTTTEIMLLDGREFGVFAFSVKANGTELAIVYGLVVRGVGTDNWVVPFVLPKESPTTKKFFEDLDNKMGFTAPKAEPSVPQKPVQNSEEHSM